MLHELGFFVLIRCVRVCPRHRRSGVASSAAGNAANTLFGDSRHRFWARCRQSASQTMGGKVYTNGKVRTASESYTITTSIVRSASCCYQFLILVNMRVPKGWPHDDDPKRLHNITRWHSGLACDQTVCKPSKWTIEHQTWHILVHDRRSGA